MKFGKGTSAALWNSIMGDVSNAGISGPTAATWAVLLFKGTPPTFAEFNSAMNSVNYQDTGTTSREPYLNFQDLIVARQSDYLGAVSGRLKFDTQFIDWNKLVLRLNGAAIGNGVALTGSNSPRFTCVVTEGTPTWFAVVTSTGANIVLNSAASLMTGTSALTPLGIIGTVGDETSTADLRIKGGKIYANSTTLTDQSRSLNISDLTLTLN